MSKKASDVEAEEFGARLVEMLAASNQPRRGAGSYLAGRYKVSTVTANDWLNGRFKPNTATARQIAEDHGSTFDWLYFGAGNAARLSTDLPTARAQPVRLDPDRLALVLTVVEGAIKDSGKRLADRARARLIAFIYEGPYVLEGDPGDAVKSLITGIIESSESTAWTT